MLKYILLFILLLLSCVSVRNSQNVEIKQSRTGNDGIILNERDSVKQK